MREWKQRSRAMQEARCLASHDGEPYGVVQDGQRILIRPLRKSLAIVNSPRHVGAMLLGRDRPGMTNDPNAVPFVCPRCGCSSEDFAELGDGNPEIPDDDGTTYDWECPCGALLHDSDLVSERDYAADRRYDQRADEET